MSQQSVAAAAKSLHLCPTLCDTIDSSPSESHVPGIARISNQSILKEINPEYSLEGLILKLKLQYFGHLMLRTDSL